MNNFSIKEALRHGWALFKSHKKTLALASLIYLIITNANVEDLAENSFIKFILFAAIGIVSLLVQIGWYKMLFKILDNTPTGVKELFQHTVLFFRYVKALVLYMVIIALPVIISAAIVFAILGGEFEYQGFSPGWAAALVLGIAAFATSTYLGIKYNFSTIIVIDQKEVGIIEAFKKSAHMTRGVKWKLIGLFITIVLVNLLGLLVLIVGVLASHPASMLAHLSIYRKLAHRE